MNCPSCSSERLFKAGMRYLATGGESQRWLCRDCGVRFSEHNNLKVINDNRGSGQVCVAETKNLDTQTETKTVCAGEKNLISYAWLQKKRGNTDLTITERVRVLKRIQQRVSDINDPAQVETMLATEPLTKAQKYVWVSCYRSYAKTFRLNFDAPRTRYEPKQPFMPTLEELTALINAGSKKTAAFLQVALTTGARGGEICRLRWTDIDTEKHAVTINDAEKNSRNRTVKVPEKTIMMVNALPKKHEPFVFGNNPIGIRSTFEKLRNRLAETQKNPRFRQIHLHTFRHYFATETLRQTKNLTYVRDLLGHKSVTNTERYTRMCVFGSEKYNHATATNDAEAGQLIEDGFEYVVTTPQGTMMFRKLK